MNRNRRPLAIGSVHLVASSVLILHGFGGLGSTALGSCTQARFAPRIVSPAGGSAQGIAVADFDRDGNLDLAVTNFTDDVGAPSDVAILLGNGQGAFGAPTRFVAGRGATRIVASDFDADDDADVAVLNGNDGTVSVFLGDGHGGLGPQTAFPAAGPAAGMAIGDFNGDGTDDLVVTDLLEARIVVLLGVGDGSFGAPAPHPVGETPLLAAVGDVDGDEYLDIAVDNVFDATVSILLGNGDGTFGPESVVPVPGHVEVRSLALSDLDGDGSLDMVVVDLSEESLLVFPGRGDGSFDAPSSFEVGARPLFVAVEDLSNDGRPDLVVGNSGDATVSVLLGGGDGTFGPQSAFVVGADPVPVALGDFDGDGDLDVVAGNVVDETVSVLLNECTGNRPPRASAGPDQVLECTGDLRAPATLDGSGSSDPDSTPGSDDDIASFEWSERGGRLASGRTVSIPLPLGMHVVSLEVTDRSGATGSDTARATVRDTIPPEIVSIEADGSVLSPPNHRLVPVSIAVVATDTCDSEPSCRIASVTSDEPRSGPGGGSGAPDWIVDDPGPETSPATLAVRLRAERSSDGTGRTYAIDVECGDAAGNASFGRATVTVPHDRGRQPRTDRRFRIARGPV